MNRMKKTIAFAMAAIMLLLCGCGAVKSDNGSDEVKEATSDTTAKSSNTHPHKVIIDTDKIGRAHV